MASDGRAAMKNRLMLALAFIGFLGVAAAAYLLSGKRAVSDAQPRPASAVRYKRGTKNGRLDETHQLEVVSYASAIRALLRSAHRAGPTAAVRSIPGTAT